MDETVTFKSAKEALMAPLNTYTQIPIRASENPVSHHFGGTAWRRAPGREGGPAREGPLRRPLLHASFFGNASLSGGGTSVTWTRRGCGF